MGHAVRFRDWLYVEPQCTATNAQSWIKVKIFSQSARLFFRCCLVSRRTQFLPDIPHFAPNLLLLGQTEFSSQYTSVWMLDWWNHGGQTNPSAYLQLRSPLPVRHSLTQGFLVPIPPGKTDQTQRHMSMSGQSNPDAFDNGSLLIAPHHMTERKCYWANQFVP